MFSIVKLLFLRALHTGAWCKMRAVKGKMQGKVTKGKAAKGKVLGKVTKG